MTPPSKARVRVRLGREGGEGGREGGLGEGVGGWERERKRGLKERVRREG